MSKAQSKATRVTNSYYLYNGVDQYWHPTQNFWGVVGSR